MWRAKRFSKEKKNKLDYKSIVKSFKLISILFLKRSRLYFPCKISIAILNGALTAIKLFFIKHMLNAITEKGDFRLALYLIIAFLAYNVLHTVLLSIVSVYFELVESDIKHEMQTDIIKKAFELEISLYDDPELYDKVTLAIEYANTNGLSVFDSVFSICSYLISLGAAIYAVSSLNPLAILILLILLFLDYAFSKKRDKMMFDFKSKIVRVLRRLDYTMNLIKCKSAMKDGQVYSALPFILEKFRSQYKEHRSRIMTVRKSAELVMLPIRIMNLLFSCVMYVFVGFDLSKNRITVGEFSMIYEAADTLRNNLIMIGKEVSNIRNMSLSVTHYVTFLELKQRVQGIKMFDPQIGFEIEFKNVWFKYNSMENWVLEDISFKLLNGKKLLLVGENGAGKTTIINLILGFYQPQQGEVLVNGIPINDYDRESYYSCISTVFQDFHSFAYSFGENVVMSTINETNRKKVLEVINKCGLADVISQLKLGLDTSVTRSLDEDGVELSGGQNQGLAISRAYYKPSCFYILDEPSSALDAISEDRLFAQFKDLASQNTAIIVSHRLSNSLHVDEILVLDKNKVCEKGSHKTLIANKGRYYDMFNMQAKKYNVTMIDNI